MCGAEGADQGVVEAGDQVLLEAIAGRLESEGEAGGHIYRVVS